MQCACWGMLFVPIKVEISFEDQKKDPLGGNVTFQVVDVMLSAATQALVKPLCTRRAT